MAATCSNASVAPRGELQTTGGVRDEVHNDEITGCADGKIAPGRQKNCGTFGSQDVKNRHSPGFFPPPHFLKYRTLRQAQTHEQPDGDEDPARDERYTPGPPGELLRRDNTRCRQKDKVRKNYARRQTQCDKTSK